MAYIEVVEYESPEDGKDGYVAQMVEGDQVIDHGPHRRERSRCVTAARKWATAKGVEFKAA